MMNEKLYDLMDWGKIEALVYSEEDSPHDFLGASAVEGGILIQAFVPSAKSVCVLLQKNGKRYEMEMADENGFFAVLVPGRSIPKYKLEITGRDGNVLVTEDPYNFEPVLTQKQTTRFNRGIHYEIYNLLGAHPMEIDGVKGVHFAVWAPNAVRVSLVGDFNAWDGRALPMRRLWNSGIFELFVPGLPVGTIYKYEIKAKGGLTFLKADPYAFAGEKAPEGASVVADLSGFEWHDQKWMKARADVDYKSAPMAVLEVHAGTFADFGEEGTNYRTLAPVLCEHVKKVGYTHVELMPVMEYPQDETLGYQPSGCYAPTSRWGSPEDFMYFMDYMHREGIGVILDWAPNQFAPDLFGLRGFDGTDLYEHHDPRKGVDPRWGSLLYNYGRPEVTNFLIGAALFWTRVYHADGLRMNDVASMLYLNNGREDGQWVANMYGGNENLEAVEFLKHLNSILKKENPDVLLIAEESGAWPMVTESVEENGLGFDLKWNNGWLSDFMEYMQLDPIFRGHHHQDLLMSMVYNYSEHFLLPLAHDEAGTRTGSLFSRMSGRRSMKFANLRAAYGYLMTHPGKKMLFMGQDYGMEKPWSFDRCLDAEEAASEDHAALLRCVSDLLALYKSQPALYALDYDSDGFEWINDISANENMLVFLRKTADEKDTLMIVCNFSPLVYENHKIGVPFHGKYKEIFNSDKEIYGGEGNVNPRVKVSRLEECDGREESIRLKVPPMGISVLTCTREDAPASENEKARKAKKGAARTAGKAPAASGKKKAGVKKNLKEELAEKVAREEKQPGEA